MDLINQTPEEGEKAYLILMIKRKAFREGQLNILKRINSILRTYCYGEERMCIEELKEYCNNLENEIDIDIQITNDILTTKKIVHNPKPE